MTTASRQDSAWKAKEQSAEAQYIRQKVECISTSDMTLCANGWASPVSQEQEQLTALRESASKARDQDFEGGFGGQEDLEDRYATTSGEH